MMNETTLNAKILSTRLGIEDHGILTAYIMIAHEHGHQGFGGYQFDYRPHKKIIYTEKCAHFVRRVLEVVGKRNWEDLPETACRVREINGYDTKLCAIGNFIEDDWFYPEKEFERYCNGE